METRYQHTIPGAEVAEADINLIATDAALADDKVFAELFRLGSGVKGVTAASGGASALIQPSGSADATIKINPFRAFIGAISPTTAADTYKNGRSAIAASTSGTSLNTIQLPAAANNRWDLIYARVDVDIDGPSVQRFVKTGTTAAAQQVVVTTKNTTVTLGRVGGTEATTPSKPATPGDSGSSYYIPLGYVLLLAGHTLTTAVAAIRIDEIAPVVQVARAIGASSLRVANGNYSESGVVLTNETWLVAGRPKGFMPPTMGGKIELIVALNEMTAPRTVTLGATSVIDDSTDWRGRIFEVTSVYGASEFGWVSAGLTPYYAHPSSSNVAQSIALGNNTIASLTSASPGASGVIAAGASVTLFVDSVSGALKCTMGSTAPGCNFFFIIKATGQHNNAF